MRTARGSGGLAAITVAALLGSAGGPIQAQQAAIQPACEVLAGLKLPRASVVSAQSAPAESIAAAVGSSLPIAVPARCVVKLLARPSADSEIGVEIWLPLTGWNGKYLQGGNGGWGGAGGAPARAYGLL